MAKYSKQDVEQAREYLLNDYLKDTTDVYVVQRSVSSSGMTRKLSLYVINDGKLLNITHLAARVLGWSLVDSNGVRAIKVTGCGMDMHFHTVYTLSAALYGYEHDNAYRLNARTV